LGKGVYALLNDRRLVEEKGPSVALDFFFKNVMQVFPFFFNVQHFFLAVLPSTFPVV